MIRFLKEPIKKQMRKTGMVRELEIDKQKLRSQNKKLINELNNLKTENRKLKNITTNLKIERTDIKKEFLSFVKSEFNPLKTENEGLQVENVGLKGLVADAQAEIGGLKGLVADVQAENQHLKDQMEKTQKVNQKFLSERSELTALIKDQINNLKVENQSLKDQINRLKVENQSLKAERANEKLLSERSDMVGYSLKTGLRGMSTDAGKPAIIKYILENVEKNAKILDVGFGSGVYGKLLRAFLYQNIDGADVYEENIKELGLDKIYDNIYIKNILDFDFDYYDLIIMGDVLEHIELESAKKLLSGFIKEKKCGNVIVSIPYEYKQGEAYGNPYERHLQPDANDEYMEKHYPYLQLIDKSTIPRRGGIMATYVWNKYMPHID